MRTLVKIIYWCSIVFLGFDIHALPTNQLALDAGARQLIASQPTESLVSVRQIFTDYRELEQRWIGKDNVNFNHATINKNPIFAKTQLFNPQYSESNQSVRYLRLSYTTNYQGESHSVSGLILLPPQTKPKGVILFFHSTMTGKLRVPSLRFNDYKAKMLAAIFAANGYVVVAPDYIGLGDDYKSEHPYIIYPQPNVNDGRDMLIASLPVFKKYALQLNHNIPLFVSGYSEGASYALWFSKTYQTQAGFAKNLAKHGYQLRKTVPIDGAYDITGVMFPFLLGNQIGEESNDFNIISPLWGTLLKPALLVNVVLSYAAHNSLAPHKIFNPAFNLQCTNGMPICNSADEVGYDLSNSRLLNLNNLQFALNYYFAALATPSISKRYGLFNNSVSGLLQPKILTNSNLLQTAQAANIVEWRSHNPISLVSLTHDSLVPEKNSANAYAGMLKSGSTNVKYLKVDNNLLKSRALLGNAITDHVGFELYALLIALQEFETTAK